MQNDQESMLEKQQNLATTQASSISVTNKQTYDLAFDFLIDVKSVMKSVKDYWAEPKAKAHEAWKSICKKESDMLNPLAESEVIVKNKMQVYADEQRRAEQEIQRKNEEARRIEADRLMKEAADAEKNGDQFQANVNMQMAQSLENPLNFTGNTRQAGTRENKVLKIVNEAQVPAYVNGVCIRPVDLVAVKKLYQLTGNLPDGIIMTTEISIVAR